MKTVALVEDHFHLRQMIKALINQLPGYSVGIEASNGFQLIEQLNATKEIPTIALIDVQMPVMDGIAVTNYLKGHIPGVAVLAMSCFCTPMLARDVLDAGAKGCLSKKHINADTLLRAFNDIDSGTVYIDADLGDKEIFKPLVNVRPEIGQTGQPKISEKEKTFLQLCTTAASYEQIAQAMNVAKETIYNYQKSLKEKTGLASRQEFMLYAIQQGIAKVARLNNS